MKTKDHSEAGTVFGLELGVTFLFIAASALLLGAAWLSSFSF